MDSPEAAAVDDLEVDGLEEEAPEVPDGNSKSTSIQRASRSVLHQFIRKLVAMAEINPALSELDTKRAVETCPLINDWYHNASGSDQRLFQKRWSYHKTRISNSRGIGGGLPTTSRRRRARAPPVTIPAMPALPADEVSTMVSELHAKYGVAVQDKVMAQQEAAKLKSQMSNMLRRRIAHLQQELKNAKRDLASITGDDDSTTTML